tara:strand:+ start:370 stop:645 length:276 start_codon:yes stop_codon:yes gene_type:complete
MCYNASYIKDRVINYYTDEIHPELEPVAILNINTFQHVNRNFEIIDVYNVEQHFSKDLNNDDEFLHILKVAISLIVFYYAVAQLYKKIFEE